MIYDSLALFGYALGASDYLVLAPAGGASSTPVVANFKSKQKIANSFVADHSSEKTYIPKLILLMLLHLLEDLVFGKRRRHQEYQQEDGTSVKKPLSTKEPIFVNISKSALFIILRLWGKRRTKARLISKMIM